MASLSVREFNVESETAIPSDRVKRVCGRLKEGMKFCSAAWLTPIERWERLTPSNNTWHGRGTSD